MLSNAATILGTAQCPLSGDVLGHRGETVGTRPLPALWASAGLVRPVDLREDGHAWTRVREPQRGSLPDAQSSTFSWRRREPRVQIRQRVETVLRMCKRRRSFTL